ncbi:MAG: amidohydrolase [Thermodesulfobacteriota bacterium]|nr:amidohydrolase [Thermodesulfobacteriota bacterium]
MESMDMVIQNGTILTMDDRNTVLDNGFVGIQAGRISHLGSGSTPWNAHRIIDAEGGLILPGLVNAHTHAAMSLFRGLADDLPLMDWLNQYIFPAEQKMDADFVFTGTLLACAEMILSGTTTFCDMYLFEDEVARAAHQAGMRCLVGEVLYDFPSPNYGPIEAGLVYAEQLIQKWRDDPLVSVAVEPHSLYTCSPDLLVKTHELAVKHDVPLIIHLAESAAENDEVVKRYGQRPVAHLSSLGLLTPRLIADHVVHVDSAEMDLLAQTGVRVVHNPESNLKLASGISPVSELIARRIPVGLGTDGCASNNNLDLFGEMDTAAKLAKVNTLDPTVLNAETVLRMATIEGARVLGMADRIGSLEIGKQADVIVLDTRKPHLTPMYNPYSQLVYAATGQDVCHAIIEGRIVMEDRRLLTFDVAEVLARAEEKAALVREWIM